MPTLSRRSLLAGLGAAGTAAGAALVTARRVSGQSGYAAEAMVHAWYSMLRKHRPRTRLKPTAIWVVIDKAISRI